MDGLGPVGPGTSLSFSQFSSVLISLYKKNKEELTPLHSSSAAFLHAFE